MQQEVNTFRFGDYFYQFIKSTLLVMPAIPPLPTTSTPILRVELYKTPNNRYTITEVGKNHIRVTCIYNTGSLEIEVPSNAVYPDAEVTFDIYDGQRVQEQSRIIARGESYTINEAKKPNPPANEEPPISTDRAEEVRAGYVWVTLVVILYTIFILKIGGIL